MRSATRVVMLALLLAVGVWVGWREREMARFHERARAEALRADSTEAARDSSRAVLLSVAGDSVRVYQRRIVQVKQRSDSLDHALGLERAARYRIAVEMTELRTRIAAKVEEQPDGERSAAFRARDGPFYIDALVTLPRPPGDGRMTLRVAIDTAVFEARVGCGLADSVGVRPATLSLAGPSWMSVRLDRLEQEPRVCSARTPTEHSGPASLAARIARRVRLGVGYGAVLAPDGRVIRGPAVTAMWSIWP